MWQRVRGIVVLLVVAVLVALAAERTRAFDRWLSKDFLEYWAAGRLNARGENPYDPDRLLAEQQLAAPWRTEAVMMWNPPPALALYMPVGVLPAAAAVLLWVCAQLYITVYATKRLWGIYAPDQPSWPAALIAVSTVGTWWVVIYGQNTGFLLLGLAGFLHFRRDNRPFAAGACAALTALKPHLLTVFGVLLVADLITRRGAKSLAAGIAVIVLALGAAVVMNFPVIGQYIDAVRHPVPGAMPLSQWWLPVPAFWLRVWLAPEQFWVQFVPCVIACVGFLAYRLWKGAAWDWLPMLPLVVAVSVITSPYGGWIFDLPVLLVPVVWAAARFASVRRWYWFAAFVAGQGAITLASLLMPVVLPRHIGLEEHWWVAPASLALCLLALPRYTTPTTPRRGPHVERRMSCV